MPECKRLISHLCSNSPAVRDLTKTEGPKVKYLKSKKKLLEMEQNLLSGIKLRVGSRPQCLANTIPNPPLTSSCKARDPQECVP